MARPGEGDAVLRDDASIATGRTLQQIAKGKTASAHEPVPGFVPPQLCRLVVAPPIGPEWTHEMKLDGYRLQLRVVGGRATLKTRTGLDWTPRFPTIAEAATRLPDALIDGEAVALDANGQPSFAALQQRLAGEGNAPIVFFAFDLLHDGKADLRARPLRERKAALHALLPARRGSTLRYVEDFPAPGAAVLASACKLSMEGVVSKLRDGPYVSGREGGWTKAKCKGRDEFVIGAWSAGASGHGLGALLLGVRGEAGLTYVGRVGTGFSGAVAQDLLRRLRLLRAGASPFHGRQPPRKAGVTWVEPELVAEIEYGGWTEDGILRHASFQGLREDKPAAEVTAPMPEPPPPKRGGRGSAPPRITHPERVIWPATETSPAITKGELAAHYARFAPLILPHVAGRPLSVLRAPEGIGAETFFQRHAMRGQSPLIGAVTIEGQPRPFMRIDDAAGLAALAQVSAVELHPWGSLAARPDEPDRLVFDLDPAPDLAFAQVVEAARELKARLEAVGLEAFPRVTGGKGLHLVVPLAAGPGSDAPPNWIAAKQFAKLVCTLMERDSPERYTTSMSKRQRTGRIFLDYLRNDRLSTAIANFSPRARPGAPVAYPLTWRAVTPGLDPAGFRLAALAAGPLPRDAWADFSAAARPLLDAIRRITRTA